MVPQRVSILSINAGSLSAKGTESFIASVVALAEEKSPSILSIQGLSRTVFRQLDGLLPAYHLANGQRRWQDEPMYSDLLVRDDVLTTEDASDVALSAERVSTVAILRPLESKRTFVAVSGALDSKNARQRMREVSPLLTAVQSAQNTGRSLPTVVTGAFYEGPNGPIHRVFTGRRTVGGKTGTYKDMFRIASPEVIDAPTDVVGSLRSDWILVDRMEMQDVHVLEPLLGHAPVLAEVLL